MERFRNDEGGCVIRSDNIDITDTLFENKIFALYGYDEINRNRVWNKRLLPLGAKGVIWGISTKNILYNIDYYLVFYGQGMLQLPIELSHPIDIQIKLNLNLVTPLWLEACYLDKVLYSNNHFPFFRPSPFFNTHDSHRFSHVRIALTRFRRAPERSAGERGVAAHMMCFIGQDL
eukprot:GHVR01034552.1.p1 GENE.GHVR01034552.1~~GHVR01034552.1.p1  ORF type:complete len:175 (+),score=40.81 GHVR01034552.1:203-727(+)